MSRKGITREVVFLTVPIVLAAAVGFFFWSKVQKSPNFLASPVQVDKAYWTDDGRVLAYKVENDSRTGTTTTRFLSWKREGNELLADVAQAGGQVSIFPSLDNKTWATIDKSLAKMILLDPSQGFTSIGEIPFAQKNPAYHTLYWISSDNVLDVTREMRGDNSYKVTVWNTKTGKVVKHDSDQANRSMPLLKTDGIQAFRISPDGKHALVQSTQLLLASSTATGLASTGPAGFKLSLISWPECRAIKQFDGDMWPVINWSRDGKEAVALATMMAGNKLVKADITRFDVSTKKQETIPLNISTIETLRATTYYPHVITHARFSPDNRFLLIPAIEQRLWKWQIFSAKTGQKCGEISSPANSVFNSAYWQSMNFSPDGQYLLQPLEQGIEIWDMNQFETQKKP